MLHGYYTDMYNKSLDLVTAMRRLFCVSCGAAAQRGPGPPHSLGF